MKVSFALRYAGLALLGAFASLTSLSAAQISQNGLISQTDPNYIAFEAEWFDRATNNQLNPLTLWTLHQSPADADPTGLGAGRSFASGNLYVRSPLQGSVNANSPNSSNNNNNQLAYRLQFTSPGDYFFYVDRLAGGGAEDSILVPPGFNVDAPLTNNAISGTFNGLRSSTANNGWTRLGEQTSPAAGYFSSGAQLYRVSQADIDNGGVMELRFGSREFNAQLDRFVLHKANNVTAAQLDALTPSTLDPGFAQTTPAAAPDRFLYAQDPLTGKWNRYEVEIRFQRTWAAAEAEAKTRSFSGTPGRLVSILDANENIMNAGLATVLTAGAWMGATDNEAYGGTEAFNTTGRPLPPAGMVPVIGPTPLPNPAVAPTESGAGYVWTSGEPFIYQIFNQATTTPFARTEPNDAGGNVADPQNSGEDALELIGGGGTNGFDNTSHRRWNDLPLAAANQLRAYIVEYPLQLDSKPNLPGSRPYVNGMWNVREVKNIGNLNHAWLAEVRLNSQEGQITENYVDYRSSAINHSDPQSSGGGGFFTGDQPFGLNTGADDNHFLLSAQGLIHIDQEDDYTFGFRGDDGSYLRVAGQSFLDSRTQTNNPFQPAHKGEFLHSPGDTGNSFTIGVVHLKPGNYKAETVFYENGGGGNYELFAARGNKIGVFGALTSEAAFKANGFNLVGAPSIPAMGGGLEKPFVTSAAGGWDVAVMSVPATPNAADHLDAAITAVRTYWNEFDNALPISQAPLGTDGPETIYYQDDLSGGGAKPGFPTQLIYPGLTGDATLPAGNDDDNFGLGARGTLSISTEGDYRFTILADDSVQLRVLGSSGWFGLSGPGGVLLTDGFRNPNNCCSDLSASVHLVPNDYDIELFMEERGGGAYVGLFAQINGSQMFLLGETGTLTAETPAVQGGLQLVPEPSSLVLAGFGLAGLLAVVVRRRRRGERGA